MVKNFGAELCTFAAGPFKKAIINNECINSLLACEGRESVDYLFCKRCCKFFPVDSRVIEKSIESVLAEILFKSAELVLHVHVLTGKDVLNLVLQQFGR